MEKAEDKSAELEVGSQNRAKAKSRSFASLRMTGRAGDGEGNAEDIGKAVDKSRGKSGGKKVVSLRKQEANRRNARLSTGPRTAQGKSASRWNALKHGLLAEALIFGAHETGEDASEFRTLLEKIGEDLRPNGAVETMLAEKVAVCYWRLRRVLRSEMGEIRQGVSGLAGKVRSQRNLARAFNQEGKSPEEERRWTVNELERLFLPQHKATDNILRYEVSLERQLYRALFQLERIQRRKEGEGVLPPVMVDQSI